MSSGKVRAIAFASMVLFGLGDTAQALAAPIDEDDLQWSCVDDGNRVCGPGNSNGVPAGCYDDGGVLFAVWPCVPWSPRDGYRGALS